VEKILKRATWYLTEPITCGNTWVAFKTRAETGQKTDKFGTEADNAQFDVHRCRIEPNLPFICRPKDSKDELLQSRGRIVLTNAALSLIDNLSPNETNLTQSYDYEAAVHHPQHTQHILEATK
jgi:hypothetical protein